MSAPGGLSPLEHLRRLRRAGIVPVAPRGVRATATAALVVYGMVRGPVHVEELQAAFQALIDLPGPTAGLMQSGGAGGLTEQVVSLLGAVCRCVVYSSCVVFGAAVLGVLVTSGASAPFRPGRLGAARAAAGRADSGALRSVVLAGLLGGALGVWLLRRYLPELVVLLRYDGPSVREALGVLGVDLAVRVVVVAVCGAVVAAVWARVALLVRYQQLVILDDDE